MFNRWRNLSSDRLKNKKGFTVLEVVVVVVMIAIATSIAAPRFAGFTDDADAEIIKADLAAVHTIAQNLAKEKEVDIAKYFQSGTIENKELIGEIKSVTNFNDDKIAKFKFGVAGGEFAVHTKDKSNTDYVWDGQNLSENKTVDAISETSIKNNKLFEQTGGYIPDPEGNYFKYANNGKTVTGLTQLGREYFQGKLIIPSVSEIDGAGPITGVNAGAFADEKLTSAYIPGSVEAIGTNSFKGNGTAGKSNSIENDVARVAALGNFAKGKYFNGHIGQWEVKGDKWEKKVFYQEIVPAGRVGHISVDGLKYRNAGVPQFHKGTIITREPIPGTDPFTQMRPVVDFSNGPSKSSRPGRIVPSTITDTGQTGTASGTINDNKAVDPVGDETVIQGRPNDKRTIKNWSNLTYKIHTSDETGNTNWTRLKWEDTTPTQRATKDYVGYHVGDGLITGVEVGEKDSIKNNFEWTGTLKQDKVINGGTAEHDMWVSAIPESAGRTPTSQPGKQPSTMHYTTGTYPNIYSTKYNNAPHSRDIPLTFDKVVNGGTDKHSYGVSGIKHPTNQTLGGQPGSWTYYVNKGHLNEYSGTVTQQRVNNGGTPAGSYNVSDVKAVAGEKYGDVPATRPYQEGSYPNVYNGTLNSYLVSGTPYHQKNVSGQFNTGPGGSAPATKPYNSAGYVGTLNRDYVSGSAYDKKWVTNQGSSNYNSGGYKGTLKSYQHGTWHPAVSRTESTTRSGTGYEWWQKINNTTSRSFSHNKIGQRFNETALPVFSTGTWGWAQIKEEETLSYTTHRIDIDGYHGNIPWTGRTINTRRSDTAARKTEAKSSNVGKRFVIATGYRTREYGGTLTKSTGTSWGSRTSITRPSLPNSVSYNSGGYVGNLAHTGTSYSNDTKNNPDSNGRSSYTETRTYSGTVTKPGYTSYVTRYEGYVERPNTLVYTYSGTVTRPDTRIFRYRGTISKPDTRLWDYHGTVSKEDTRLWDYKGTIGKGDTREWDYSGEVTSDTREWRYYYYYRAIIE